MRLTRDQKFKLLFAQRGRCTRCGAKLQLDRQRDDNYATLKRRRFGGPGSRPADIASGRA
jgi:hypothetical protein